VNETVPGDRDDAQGDRDVAKIAARLTQDRPAPGATLRREVRAFLDAVDASGLLIARPRRLWLRVGVCAGAGCALLALVATGIGGWGPFAG
jgi:hypothetical protein